MAPPNTSRLRTPGFRASWENNGTLRSARWPRRRAPAMTKCLARRSVQVTGPPAAAMAARAAAAAPRRLAQFERAHQGVEALGEQLVDLAHHAVELGGIEVAFHEVHH